jgi:hypothetical protein
MSTVDHASTDTAALLRRVVRRTLTILGGSVAGTAIAWAISSASASADTQHNCDTPQVPNLAQLSTADYAAAQHLVKPVSDLVCALEQVVPDHPVTNTAHAADDFGRQLTDQIAWVPTVPVDLSGLGRSDLPGASAPGGGAHETPSLARPVGEQTAAAPSTPLRFGASDGRTATERALGDGLSRRGSPAPSAPQPGKPFPVPNSPATVPSSGSTGHTGAGADSPAFVALPWSCGLHGLTGWQASPVRNVPSADEPGTQPGVTPD